MTAVRECGWANGKSEPFGTEFKVVADTATGINIGLEIQERMHPIL
jgi:hypothetical protein